MTGDFDGDTVIVTGGSSGIGEATAHAFAEHGASVVIGDVAAAAEDTVADIEASGGDATFVRTDVSDPAAVDDLVAAAVEEYGGLDAAVNNAGIEGASAPTGEYPIDGWQEVIDVNLTGVFLSTRAELQQFAAQEAGGAVVNVASILGHVGFENSVAYTAAKHGVVGLTQTAAQEYAEQGVRVNAVCPGFVETPMLERGGITSDEEMRTAIENMHPVGRLGEPREIADAIVWLASDEASFVTGESFAVDGGYLSR